jgi:hypothetical protein
MEQTRAAVAVNPASHSGEPTFDHQEKTEIAGHHAVCELFDQRRIFLIKADILSQLGMYVLSKGLGSRNLA